MKTSFIMDNRIECQGRGSMESDAHFRQSTLRERIVEHVFIGDALRLFWRRGITDVEVLRSEFDAHDYDLVMARGRIVRHIQFKTGTKKPAKVSVAQALADKPSGCVIFIMIAPTLELGPFYWFGADPGLPLPEIAGFRNPRRATHNKAGERPLRPNHREVAATHFSIVPSFPGILEKLFGPLPGEAVSPD
jgi:hypothetical protein